MGRPPSATAAGRGKKVTGVASGLGVVRGRGTRIVGGTVRSNSGISDKKSSAPPKFEEINSTDDGEMAAKDELIL